MTNRQKMMLFCIERLYNTGHPAAIELRQLFFDEHGIDYMGPRPVPEKKKNEEAQET